MLLKYGSVISVLILLFAINASAQSFGFGCLGLVGGYGGYSYQQYKPSGLNDYIAEFNLIRQDSLSGKLDDFGKASGYRVGLNFFRADLKGFILTAKGFYQNLQEKHSASTNGTDVTSTELKLTMKSWSLGFDLGTSITGALSWKVIDAALMFNSATLVHTTNFPNAETKVINYDTENTKIGYSIGTGFILKIIDEYISIEGLAAYTVFKIDKMKNSDGDYFPIPVGSSEQTGNFIESGGFNAVIQLNIGFPL